jgi:hypothetical protein
MQVDGRDKKGVKKWLEVVINFIAAVDRRMEIESKRF